MREIEDRIKELLTTGKVGKAIELFEDKRYVFNEKSRKNLSMIFYATAKRIYDKYGKNEAVTRLTGLSHELDRNYAPTKQLLSHICYQEAEEIRNYSLANALKKLKKALKFNKNNEYAKKLLEEIAPKSEEKVRAQLRSKAKRDNALDAKIELCKYDFEHGVFEVALVDLEKIEYNSENLEIVILYARVDILHNKLDEATNKLLGLKVKFKDVRINQLLSKIYMRLGNTKDALSELLEAREIDSNNIDVIKQILNYFIAINDIDAAKLIFDSNKDKLNMEDNDINLIEFYINYKLGAPNRLPESYVENQLICYSKRDVISRLVASNINKPHNVSAAPIITCPIDKLYDAASKKIADMIPNESGVLDVYVIKLQDEKLISKVNTRFTYTYNIFTLSGTKNIVNIMPISMIPSESMRRTNQFDIR